MDIIVKPSNKDINKYIESGITNFLFPLKDFAVDSINYYTLDEIKEYIKRYNNINIFISINKNIFNSELEELEKILKEISKLNIKAVFFYDLSVLSIKNKNNLDIDLVWNSTYMVTNYKTCDYYFNKGIKYALVSKEITKNEIIEISKKSKINLIVELISKPVVAFSKRKLLSNYFENYNLEKKDNLEIEEEKTNQKYIVKEDNNGVSFILDKIMNGSYILKELIDNDIKYILLKEDYIDSNIFLESTKNIIDYINNYKVVDEKEFLNKQAKLLGRNTNFFYRKTIYKVKK